MEFKNCPYPKDKGIKLTALQLETRLVYIGDIIMFSDSFEAYIDRPLKPIWIVLVMF